MTPRRPSTRAAGVGLPLLVIALLAAACGGREAGGGVAAGPLSASPTASPSEPTPVAEGEYANPVFEPMLADPSVLRADDGTFYAYGTEDDWGDGEGMRPVPVLRSPDLVAWEHVSEAFAGGERPAWKQGGLWAPDVERVGDTYLMYYSLSVWGDADPGIGVAVADRPEGPFTDRGKLFTSSEIGVENSIDPFLFVDDAGAPTLFWGSFHGISGVPLSPDGLAVAGDPFPVAGTDYEAPYIVEHDGAFWFFGSAGSCCDYERSTYHVLVGRADALRGPYVDREGRELLDNGGTVLLQGDDEWAGPGHNALATDDAGSWWIVYHAIDRDDPRSDSGSNRRVLMVDPLAWEDGWPSVEGLVPGDAPRPAPEVDADVDPEVDEAA